jgi:hypothetical protein
MLVGEEETEETAAEATDTVGTGTRGRISIKGGVLLNSAAVVAALDDAEQRRAAKAAETARKDTLSEQRQVVVMQLKLYRYIYLSMMPAGDWWTRCGASSGRTTSRVKEWKGRVKEHLVPRLHQLFQDPMRTWTPALPPTPAPADLPARECPTDARTAHHRIRPTIDSDIRPHIFSELCSRRVSRQRAHSALHTRTDREEAEERECSACACW